MNDELIVFLFVLKVEAELKQTSVLVLHTGISYGPHLTFKFLLY